MVLWAIGTAIVLIFASGLLLTANIGVYAGTRNSGVSGLVATLVAAVSLLIFLAIVLLRLFALALVRLDYEKRWYVVTDRSLRVREGVVIVREMTITFANVQNLSISQGPIQRALGLADLVVETAGGGAVRGKHQPGLNLHTASFRGVDNAQEVKDLIQQRLRALKDSGLGDHEESGAGQAHMTTNGVLEALRAVYDEARRLRLAVRE
jgi:uncharacterized membrane protein YdbT with pleckstrin-like domain